MLLLLPLGHISNNYLHREGPNLGKNIVSLVSCYHPALSHSSGPPTRDPPVLTPTPIFPIVFFGRLFVGIFSVFGTIRSVIVSCADVAVLAAAGFRAAPLTPALWLR